MTDKEQGTSAPETPSATTAVAGAQASNQSETYVTVNVSLEEIGRTLSPRGSKPRARGNPQPAAQSVTKPNTTTPSIAPYRQNTVQGYSGQITTPNIQDEAARSSNNQGRNLAYPIGDIRNTPVVTANPRDYQITQAVTKVTGHPLDPEQYVTREFVADGGKVVFQQPVSSDDTKNPIYSTQVFFYERNTSGGWQQVMSSDIKEGNVDVTVANAKGKTDRFIVDPSDRIWGPWVGVDRNADNMVSSTDVWSQVTPGTINKVIAGEMRDYFLARPTLRQIVAESGYPVASLNGEPATLDKVLKEPKKYEFKDTNEINTNGQTWTGHVPQKNMLREIK